VTDDQGGLRERKKKKLRQQIIRAAVELFNTRGYQETRVADIVAKLDISQPTFFRYFPSKDAVLREILETGSAVGRKRFNEHISTSVKVQSKSFESNCRDWIRGIPAWAGQNKTLVRALWSPVTDDPARAQKKEAKVRTLLEMMIELGQQRGEITNDMPKEQLGQMVSGMFKRIILDWVSEETPPYDLEERLNAAFSVFLRGAMTAPAPAESLPSPAEAEGEASDSD